MEQLKNFIAAAANRRPSFEGQQELNTRAHRDAVKKIGLEIVRGHMIAIAQQFGPNDHVRHMG